MGSMRFRLGFALLFVAALASCRLLHASRPNTLRLVDDTPDLAFHGAEVKQVRARGFDASGKLVFGPAEEIYDHDIAFVGFPDDVARVDLEFQRGQGHTLALHTAEVDFPGDDDGEIVLRNLAPEASPKKTTFTVRIENDSDYGADEVFVTVLGKDRAKKAFYYLKFGDEGDNTAEPFGGTDRAAEYSVPLSRLTKETEPHIYSFQCPREYLVSGRIYIAFGEKLEGLGLNDTSDPLSLQLPSPSGAPDASKLWEFMELSATIPDDPKAPQVYTLFANTSVVDFFSIGLGMTMNVHEKPAQTVGFVEGAREKVLAAFEAPSMPAEFQNYVNKGGALESKQAKASPGSDGAPRREVLRVLAPVQKVALDPNGKLSEFLESQIAKAWTSYGKSPLQFPDNIGGRPYGYTYEAVPTTPGGSQFLSAEGRLIWTCTAAPSSDKQSVGESYSLLVPTSRIAYECDAPLGAGESINNAWTNGGSDGHKRLASLILAAINRGVFESYADWASAEKFYARTDGKYNHFSKIMHDYAIDGKVYGFGYDDIYGQDPTLAAPLDDVNQVVLKIPKFERL